MQALTKEFFKLHLAWLARVVRAGVAEGSLLATHQAGAASWLLATLEGGSLIAWATGDRKHLLLGFEQVLAALQASA